MEHYNDECVRRCSLRCEDADGRPLCFQGHDLTLLQWWSSYPTTEHIVKSSQSTIVVFCLCDCDTEVEFKARVIVIEFRRGGDISIEDDVEADVLGETTRKVYCSRCKHGNGQLAEVFYAKTIVIGRGNAESSSTL